MHYIEAPGETNRVDLTFYLSLFLAGGITGCPDWQKEAVEELKDCDIVVFNPRRANFPIGNSNAAKRQIAWEYDKLKRSDLISFWFPKETICPIVLYELGAWSKTNKAIVVGVHPEYTRRRDVEIQMSLVRPRLEVQVGFEAFLAELKKNV